MSSGRILMENTPFSGFSSGLCRQNCLAIVGGIHISGGLAAIFAGLEFAGLLYMMRFAGESPGYASFKSEPPTSVHPRRIGPVRGGIYLQNLSLISPQSLRKIKLKLNRWLANSPAHIYHYISGLK
jgi:hypothetical protein